MSKKLTIEIIGLAIAAKSSSKKGPPTLKIKNGY
jgi:hypothetical protein